MKETIHCQLEDLEVVVDTADNKYFDVANAVVVNFVTPEILLAIPLNYTILYSIHSTAHAFIKIPEPA